MIFINICHYTVKQFFSEFDIISDHFCLIQSLPKQRYVINNPLTLDVWSENEHLQPRSFCIDLTLSSV